jgi:ABC-type dipeptide/oligopeptide/nickel transport system permease subunit
MAFNSKSVLSAIVIAVFTVAACFIVWFIGYTFIMNYETRSWEEVPAKVLDYDLKTSRSGSAGTMRTTFNSSIKASYSYSYNGRTYVGDRVDFSFGSDNFSDKRRSRQMAQLREGNITVYVNPDNPGQSVFDRSLPAPQIAFAIIFLIFPCGLGTMFIIGSILWILKKIGFTWTDRFMMPFSGVFHGAPAIYPVFFDPGSLGFGTWIIMLAFLGLFVVSLISIYRRILDPSLGEPKWPDRLKKPR